MELKKLLNKYLGDDRNALYQIPPAQTMRIRAKSPMKTNAIPDAVSPTQRQFMKQSDAMKEKMKHRQ